VGPLLLPGVRNMPSLYVPTNNKETLDLINKAAEHNKELDRCDIAAGNLTPAEAGLDVLLRTAISAIVCGIDRKNWNEVAEGLVMLIQAEQHVRRK
jgi:hypothetical protein